MPQQMTRHRTEYPPEYALTTIFNIVQLPIPTIRGSDLDPTTQTKDRLPTLTA